MIKSYNGNVIFQGSDEETFIILPFRSITFISVVDRRILCGNHWLTIKATEDFNIFVRDYNLWVK